MMTSPMSTGTRSVGPGDADPMCPSVPVGDAHRHACECVRVLAHRAPAARRLVQRTLSQRSKPTIRSSRLGVRSNTATTVAGTAAAHGPWQGTPPPPPRVPVSRRARPAATVLEQPCPATQAAPVLISTALTSVGCATGCWYSNVSHASVHTRRRPCAALPWGGGVRTSPAQPGTLARLAATDAARRTGGRVAVTRVVNEQGQDATKCRHVRGRELVDDLVQVRWWCFSCDRAHRRTGH